MKQNSLSMRQILNTFANENTTNNAKAKTKLNFSSAGERYIRQRLTAMKAIRQQTKIHGNMCAFTSETDMQQVAFDSDSCEIVIDTGASASFSHCLEDFISFKPMDSTVSGLGTLNIKGIGTIKYKVVNDNKEIVNMIIKNAYYVPDLQTRLLSPQQLISQQLVKQQCSHDDKVYLLRWKGNTKTVKFQPHSNLPMLRTAGGYGVIKSLNANLKSANPVKCFKARREIPRFQLQPELEQDSSDTEETLCSFIDNNKNKSTSETTSRAETEIEPVSDTIKVKCSRTNCSDCSRVFTRVDDTNLTITDFTNLTDDQKLLLHYHEKLDHMNFKRIKHYCKLGLLPKRLAKVEAPVCLACQMGKGHKVSRSRHNKIVNETITKPGQLVHVDQGICSQPGRPMTLSGQNNSNKITVFTLFVDSISKKLSISFQHSTKAEATIDGKNVFEREAAAENVKIHNYRADNGTFRAKAFIDDCTAKDQRVTFCGVGAHWQNGVAERHIRTIVERARTVLLHASAQWPDDIIETELWTFALNHCVQQWNKTPRPELNNLTPDEVFTGITERENHVLDIDNNFHPFGCPVYVLKSKLQDNKTIPKWDSRMRTGVFLGHSKMHARNVALVMNTKTMNISPQYHVIFDDKFQTLDSKLKDVDKIKIWEGISKRALADNTSATESVDFKCPDFEPEQVSYINTNNNNPLRLATTEEDSDTAAADPPQSKDTNTSSTTTHKRDLSQRELKSSFRKRTSQVSFSDGHSEIVTHERPTDNRVEEMLKQTNNTSTSTRQDKPTVSSSSHRHRRRTQYVLHPGYSSTESTGSRKSKRKRKPSAKVRDAFDAMHSLAADIALDRNQNSNMSFNAQIERILDLSMTPEGEINDLNPHSFIASVNPNILNHRDAMKAHDREAFENAMREEINKMMKEEIFEEVPYSEVPKTHNVLGAVWSHRRKTTPTGDVYRHRSRLCVNGSQQTEGIDYTETYSPVISWTCVRIMLILSSLLGLKSRQVDYVQAFPQATLPEGEQVYMRIPTGYKTDRKNTVLKLLKNCYGLKQAAYNWNNHLKAGLEQLGFKASAQEPCLYMKDDIICLVYVDDTLFFAKDDSIIDDHIRQLQNLNFDLTIEGDIESFLGVKVEKDDKSIKMSQPALTQTILDTLGLQDDSKCHDTPAVSPPLHAHKNGAERKEKWSYRSVIGMLTYLARNTRPDIEYAVHQCARFQINPKLAHENAIKRIGRYLLGTKDKGVIFSPNPNKIGTIECFVDADFAGNYAKEISDDPSSVKSRTGCVIKFGNCPITWFSRMQTEIALSTTEAEYIALSTATRELLPMRELLVEISTILKLEEVKPTIRCTLFEDNVGAETLARTPNINPRTKHIAIKYHHFRDAVKNKILFIHRVETENQLADIFTKAVPRPVLRKLRHEIMGWQAMFRRPKLGLSKEKERTRHTKICNFASVG